jgi:uncharacterized protein (UPF0332 family)
MMEGEQNILEKAAENIKAAELLIGQGFKEIGASRGYYALFYIAEALLFRRGLHFSSHAAVIAAYGKEFAKTKDLDPKFHQYLIQAQEVRQTSDYGFTETISAFDAEQVLAWARDFLKAAENYLK